MIIPEKETRRKQPPMVESTAQGAPLSSDAEDRTDRKRVAWALRASRACKNTRITGGCLNPTCKAVRKIREEEGSSWGLRF